jgi:predicted aspartyl protease
MHSGSIVKWLFTAAIALLLSDFARLSLVRSLWSSPAPSQLEEDAQQLLYNQLERDLNTASSGPERDLFAGVLDNSTGDIDESIRKLETALPAIRAARPERMGMALETLADDYLKAFRYRDASRTYQELISGYASQLQPGDRQDVEDDNATIKLLVDAPPQAIHWNATVDVPMHRSPLGSFDTDLTVNGVIGPWLLDTGANFSVLTETFSRRLGVRVFPGTAQTKGSSGTENILHVGLIPEIEIGGAVLNNVVALIIPDENLKLPTGPGKTYQINAIIGYPVFQSLGKVTFARTGRFLAGGSAISTGTYSRIFMYKLTPLIECGVHGKERLFAFDTGANGSAFFCPYYREFTEYFGGMKLGRNRTAGAGGQSERRA